MDNTRHALAVNYLLTLQGTAIWIDVGNHAQTQILTRITHDSLNKNIPHDQ